MKKNNVRVNVVSTWQSAFRIVALFLAVVSITSCDKDDVNTDPSICFQHTEGQLYAEMGVEFDASCSQQTYDLYAWDFGDGDFGTGAKVNHTFDAAGQYRVLLTATAGNLVKTVAKTITVQPSPFIKHCDDIAGTETWEEGLHLVTCDIDVNGTLTIKPGAVVYMANERSLKVNGKLVAQGTSAKPIKILPANNSTTPGAWGHISFSATASSESILDYCEIKFGGKGSTWFYPHFEYYSSWGTVHLTDCEISINNTKIESGAAYGLVLTSNAKLKSFQNNAFTANTKSPIRIPAKVLHQLGSSNRFTSENDIQVVGEDYLYIPSDVTWYKQDVGYAIDGRIGLSSNFAITIQPGCTLKFDREGLSDAAYFAVMDGSIKAIGTAAEPIVFTSSKATKAAGDWGGLLLGNNSILKYVTIEYAGSEYRFGYHRGLYVSGTTIVENSTISNISGTGLDVGSGTATIRNNVIKDCAGPGITVLIQNQHIIEDSNVMTNTQGMHMNSGSGFNTNVTLKKRAFPYVINDIPIWNATLTIEPGVEIHMRSGGSITMGWNNSSNGYSGNIKANGTAAEPIKIGLYPKDKQDGKKNWGAIFFGETSTTSVLNYCVLTDGGQPIDGNGNTFTDTGIINCYKTAGFPTITNCTISNSATYGIALKTGSTITASNNTLTNNALGNTFTN
ncbi:MAG TPA: right-handed parallel beta-helix repeat-containing protein [Chryseosolibacter sp.]